MADRLESAALVIALQYARGLHCRVHLGYGFFSRFFRKTD
jgi:hypothetical protein